VVALHQLVQALLGEPLSVAADPRVGRSPPEPADHGQTAGGEVADRLGDDHALACGLDHPIDDCVRVRKEVVQACLDDRDVGARERLRVAHEVEPTGIDAAAPEAPDEPVVDVQPDV
jgi:hypothetical protein